MRKHPHTVHHCNYQTDFAEGKGICVCSLERDTAVLGDTEIRELQGQKGHGANSTRLEYE